MQTNSNTFLTGPQVAARYSRSLTSIWRWMNDKALGFPRPLKVRGLNYWKLADLEAWESKQGASA